MYMYNYTYVCICTCIKKNIIIHVGVAKHYKNIRKVEVYTHAHAHNAYTQPSSTSMSLVNSILLVSGHLAATCTCTPMDPYMLEIWMNEWMYIHVRRYCVQS